MLYNNININFNKLFSSKLSIESYFLLYIIYLSDKSILEKYVDKCSIINNSATKQLILNLYIEYIDIEQDITFNMFKITDKGSKLFEDSKLDHTKFFNELKEVYPKKTPQGRKLHTDQENCRKKYKALVDSEDKHNLIIKCLKLYINDLKSIGKQEIIQGMPAWINQKNYEAYLEEAERLNTIVSNEEEEYNTI